MHPDEVGMRRIGDIASATGLTVRTLHYYEEIGLITPASRTPAGHRLYGTEALDQIYRISALRQLAVSLDGIRQALDGGQADLADVLHEHVAALDARRSTEQRLSARLHALLDVLDTQPVDDSTLINILEDMAMLDSPINERISILVYRDIEAAHDYLIRVFGLGPGALTRDGDGNVVHGEVNAGDGVLWLHPESAEFGLASPASLGAASATMAVMVDDVDAHHAHAAAEGADVRYSPVDQPYGYREYSAVDPEGHLFSFMKPLTFD